jgi:hypothetical protein
MSIAFNFKNHYLQNSENKNKLHTVGYPCMLLLPFVFRNQAGLYLVLFTVVYYYYYGISIYLKFYLCITDIIRPVCLHEMEFWLP